MDSWRSECSSGESQGTLSVCSTQDPPRHQAILGTAFFMLTLFVALYVLVYVECLVRRWLWALALLTWACLMMLGFVLVWDSWKNDACAWEQVMVGADATGLGSKQLGYATSSFLPTCGFGAYGSGPGQACAVASLQAMTLGLRWPQAGSLLRVSPWVSGIFG